jgi:hypothetical protein
MIRLSLLKWLGVQSRSSQLIWKLKKLCVMKSSHVKMGVEPMPAASCNSNTPQLPHIERLSRTFKD